MVFVGRRRETRRILDWLEEGSGAGHLVVMGRFGIGRTRLLQHVADLLRERRRFVFVDFSQTAARVSHQILARLSAPAALPSSRSYTHYAVSRFKLSHLEPAPGPAPVVVLDDIQKVTGPRLRFLRQLALEGPGPLVAVADASVPDPDLRRLRAAMLTAPMLRLGHLPPARVAEFLRHYCGQYGLGWSDRRILTLARATGGYPPAMVEVVRRAVGRSGRLVPRAQAHAPSSPSSHR